MKPPDEIATDRLRLRRLTSDDVAAMADILSEPRIAIRVMCDASTPEKRRHEAARRIEWFNSYWSSGYGVRAVTIGDPSLGGPGRLIGWCGVAGYEGAQGEPEILYGLDRRYWGKRLITEAGHAAIADFFARTDEPSVCAIVFAQLNRESVQVAEKLGLSHRKRVAFADFAPSRELRERALDYALWCAESPAARKDPQLLVDAAAKAGLIVGSGVGDAEEVRERLRRSGQSPHAAGEVLAAFESARADPFCPYLSLAGCAGRGS